MASKKFNCPKPRITKALVFKLQRYDWPGNIRELQNVIERSLIVSGQQGLQFDIPQPDTSQSPPRLSTARCPDDIEEKIVSEKDMRQQEKDNTLAALRKSGWKIYGSDGAAELLGIKPTTLVAWYSVAFYKRKSLTSVTT